MNAPVRTAGANGLRSVVYFTQVVSASAPLILLVLLVSLATHIRAGLGHWPKPMTEDLHTLAFQWHDKLVGIWLLFSLFGAAPVWCICQFIPSPGVPRQKIGTQVALFIAGWCATFILGYLDPTSFTEWFLD